MSIYEPESRKKGFIICIKVTSYIHHANEKSNCNKHRASLPLTISYMPCFRQVVLATCKDVFY